MKLHRFKRILQFCRPHWARFTLLFLCILVTTFIGSLFNYLFGLMVDQVIMAKSMVKFLQIVALQALVFGVNQVLHYALNMNWAHLMTRFLFDIRRALFDSVVHYKGHVLSNMASGDLSSRMNQDANEFMNFIHWNVFYGVGSVLNLALAVAFIAYSNTILALVVVVLTPITVYVTGYFAVKIDPLTKDLRKKEGLLSAWLYEILVGMQEVRLLGAGPHVSKTYVGQTHATMKLAYRAQWMTLKSERVSALVNVVGQLALFAVSALLIYKGQLTLGGFVAALGYFKTCVGAFRVLNGKIMDFPKNFAGIDRVFAALDRPREVDAVEGCQSQVDPSGQPGHVRFDHIAFSYGAEVAEAGVPVTPVLKDICLDLAPGQVTALVGRSGSGKSTIASLMQRYYEPTQGQILIDGIPLQHMTYAKVRKTLGIVHQDTIVFNATVAYNVSLLPDQDLNNQAIVDQINQVLEAVDLTGWLQGLPRGLSTEIGDGPGFINMSGGQRQRLALARLLFKKTPVLILDEATSSVDAQTEAVIRRAWEQGGAGAPTRPTWLIIAHRLETIVAAHSIVVLEEGSIVDRGCHADLLQRCAVYQDLFLRQSQGLMASGEDQVC